MRPQAAIPLAQAQPILKDRVSPQCQSSPPVMTAGPYSTTDSDGTTAPTEGHSDPCNCAYFTLGVTSHRQYIVSHKFGTLEMRRARGAYGTSNQARGH